MKNNKISLKKKGMGKRLNTHTWEGKKKNVPTVADHGIWPITSWQIDGKTIETVTDFILGGSKLTADSDCSHEIKRCLLLGRKAMTNLDSIIKKQRHHFADKGLNSQSYGFSSSHVQMWELDHKDGWSWERLRAGKEGGNGGLDGWMASLTQWTWVWANSRR